jgi:hypothetical protein
MVVRGIVEGRPGKIPSRDLSPMRPKGFAGRTKEQKNGKDGGIFVIAAVKSRHVSPPGLYLRESVGVDTAVKGGSQEIEFRGIHSVNLVEKGNFFEGRALKKKVCAGSVEIAEGKPGAGKNETETVPGVFRQGFRYFHGVSAGSDEGFLESSPQEGNPRHKPQAPPCLGNLDRPPGFVGGAERQGGKGKGFLEGLRGTGGHAHPRPQNEGLQGHEDLFSPTDAGRAVPGEIVEGEKRRKERQRCRSQNTENNQCAKKFN